MRLSFAFVLLLPTFSLAQTKEMIESVQQRLETLKWIAAQESATGGFYIAPQDPNIDAMPRPSLRATNGAVRAWKYLGGENLGSKFPNPEKHAAFVLKCYDPKTGGFAEPGAKPDVASTSIGVMAAVELGIPKEKFAKAMDFLCENAKTFEEVRIAAAAVEAWGVKDCPFDVKEMIQLGTKLGAYGPYDTETQQNGGARQLGSTVALVLRLGAPIGLQERKHLGAMLGNGQRDDGGWGKKDEKASDIETTYRVLRALMLVEAKPVNLKKLREFVESHRNRDGAFAIKPGDKSSMSGVYYAAIISKWLDDMEKNK